VECPQLVESLFEKVEKAGSMRTDFFLTIDLTKGTILEESTKFSFPAWDEQAMLIFESGGLVEFTKQKLSGQQS